MRRWWENMLTALPDYDIEVVDMRDLGDVMLASRALSVTGRKVTCRSRTCSGTRAGGGGKCVWWRAFAGLEAEALEAVGLRE